MGAPEAITHHAIWLSSTLFVIAAGIGLIWGFVRWQRYRERNGHDPLVHLDLIRIPPLRAGLFGLFTQNLVLMGAFFVIPLYLQLVLGLNALDTGIKMLPVSVLMFLAAAAGSRLSNRFSIRAIVRTGLLTSAIGVFVLIGTVDPTLSDAGFAISMAILGLGMGLLASQLGNVVQSSVDASGRAEAGGLQYTGQQLGSSLGVALIGAVVLAGLASVFVSQINDDERIADHVAAQVTTAVEPGLDFVSADQIAVAATNAGLDQATTHAVVEDYEQAQLAALKAGLLIAGLVALGSLMFTRDLPHQEVRNPQGAASM